MCSIRIKMGETWTARNPDSQDSSREKPKDPEGGRRPETLSEVLNPPPCSRRALQPPSDWRPPRASSAVSVGVIGDPGAVFPPECGLGCCLLHSCTRASAPPLANYKVEDSGGPVS